MRFLPLFALVVYLVPGLFALAAQVPDAGRKEYGGIANIAARATDATATDQESMATASTSNESNTTATGETSHATATANSTTTSSTATPATTTHASLNTTAPFTNGTSPVPPGELPIKPVITPAMGIGGFILLATGAVLAVIGIRNLWVQVFLSTAFLTALGVTVLIEYVMHPPVSAAVQGAYLVAVFFTGVTFGALSIVFKELTEGLGCLLGGFCVSMWLLCLRPGGLLRETSSKSGFIGAISVGIYALSFSHYTRAYGLIGSTAICGGTAVALGIDCFSRAGLKEFWLYIWALNDDVFPLGTKTYPVTRNIRVELAAIVIIAVLGVISQLRLWKVVRERRRKDEEARLEEQHQREEAEAENARQLEEKNLRERKEWEEKYGDPSAIPEIPDSDGSKTCSVNDEKAEMVKTELNSLTSSSEGSYRCSDCRERCAHGESAYAPSRSSSVSGTSKREEQCDKEHVSPENNDDTAPSCQVFDGAAAAKIKDDKCSEVTALMGSDAGSIRSQRFSRTFFSQRKVVPVENSSGHISESREALVTRDDTSSVQGIRDEASDLDSDTHTIAESRDEGKDVVEVKSTAEASSVYSKDQETGTTGPQKGLTGGEVDKKSSKEEMEDQRRSSTTKKDVEGQHSTEKGQFSDEQAPPANENAEASSGVLAKEEQEPIMKPENKAHKMDGEGNENAQVSNSPATPEPKDEEPDEEKQKSIDIEPQSDKGPSPSTQGKEMRTESGEETKWEASRPPKVNVTEQNDDFKEPETENDSKGHATTDDADLKEQEDKSSEDSHSQSSPCPSSPSSSGTRVVHKPHQAATSKKTTSSKSTDRSKPKVEEPPKLNARTVKNLPQRSSNLVQSYRTNEWAKHLADAEAPEPDPIEAVQEEEPECPEETEEAPVPVNVNELLQTPLNAPPPPAVEPRTSTSLGRAPSDAKQNHRVSSESHHQRSPQSRQKGHRASGVSFASQPNLHSTASPVAPSQQTQTFWGDEGSPQQPTPTNAVTLESPEEREPVQPRWKGPPPLMAVREGMVRNRLSTLSLAADPWASRNSLGQSPSPSASPTAESSPRHASMYPMPEDADNMPLSRRRTMLHQQHQQQQQQQQQQRAVSSPHPRWSHNGTPTFGNDPALMAAWRESVHKDLHSQWTPGQRQSSRGVSSTVPVSEAIAEGMQRGDMSELHREAMRRMQAKANRNVRGVDISVDARPSPYSAAANQRTATIPSSTSPPPFPFPPPSSSSSPAKKLPWVSPSAILRPPATVHLANPINYVPRITPVAHPAADGHPLDPHREASPLLSIPERRRSRLTPSPNSLLVERSQAETESGRSSIAVPRGPRHSAALDDHDPPEQALAQQPQQELAMSDAQEGSHGGLRPDWPAGPPGPPQEDKPRHVPSHTSLRSQSQIASIPSNPGNTATTAGEPDVAEELAWGPAHPCYPHINPHVPLNSQEYLTTRVIRIRRDWMVKGDLAPTFSNLYPEILDPLLPEHEFRKVVSTVNEELMQAFDPFRLRNWVDGLLGLLTGWLWEDFGAPAIKGRLQQVEEFLERWNREVGEKDGVHIWSLRRTAYMSLDIQIPDPKVGIIPQEMEPSMPGTRPGSTA